MTAPTEMEDRVAKALAAAARENETRGFGYWDMARVAIRAMRKPTEDMLQAAGGMRTEAEAEWPAMIDAASPGG